MRKREKGNIKNHHSLPSVIALSGTKVMTGTGLMVIISVGKYSAMGMISEHLKGEEELTPL